MPVLSGLVEWLDEKEQAMPVLFGLVGWVPFIATGQTMIW
jgi:hypothetical protein